jgi:hypothetical protein
MTFCEAMAVTTLRYRSEIWSITTSTRKKQTAEMKFLWSAAGYTRKCHTRRTKITEELNILNVNLKIIKFRSNWKYHVQRMEDRRILKKV